MNFTRLRHLRAPHIQLNYLGIIAGLLGYFIALTPSLMPREADYMGLVAGVGFALGYLIGLTASHLIRHYHVLSELSPARKRTTWLTLLIATPLYIAAVSLIARYWQNDQRALLEQPQIDEIGALRIVLIAGIVFALFVLIQKSILALYRFIRQRTTRLWHLSATTNTLVAAVLAIIVVWGIVTGFVERVAVAAINTHFQRVNTDIDPYYRQPTSALRSGSAESAADWVHLGKDGRQFVASGPSAEKIRTFTGKPAKQPIRVYAGLDNADGRDAQINLVIRELERTGAFERKFLMVTVPTGSGWVEPETVAAFEYMHDGDTAIATAQYSYLPSGFSYLFDKTDTTDMGKRLFHAIDNKLRTLPEDERPELIAYGLSLGSYGMQSEFTGEADFASKIDGGLFVGTPGFSEPWRAITAERSADSPQIKPIYHDEKVIKFANDSSDLEDYRDHTYKVVYFQYATDPFVWWNASLLYAKPDWLREAPGRGVSPHFHWFPVITFLQVSADQAYALSISGNNGHHYSEDTVAALAAATRPSDWSDDKTAKLQHHLTPSAK